MGVELIAIHVPKCAGTTFAVLLGAWYGKAVLYDGPDRILDPESSFQRDFEAWKKTLTELGRLRAEPIKAISGHIWAGKYDDVFPGARKIIWLRDPIHRLVSHYFFWKSLPSSPHSLHRLVTEQNLSLLEFAQIPQMQNILVNAFMRERTLRDFDFVGITEHFQDDLSWLASRMKWKNAAVGTTERRNTNEEYRAFRLDPELEKKLRALNAADLELYESALELRRRRERSSKIWNVFGTAAILKRNWSG
jgi:hypothetical protein